MTDLAEAHDHFNRQCAHRRWLVEQIERTPFKDRTALLVDLANTCDEIEMTKYQMDRLRVNEREREVREKRERMARAL